MNQLTKEQIAKELLKPYFDDPSLCSISWDGKRCLYNGGGGRMCVFAKACTPEGRELLEEGLGAEDNLFTGGASPLQPKYSHILDSYFWGSLQAAHDNLAKNKAYNRAVELYRELTGEEYSNDK